MGIGCTCSGLWRSWVMLLKIWGLMWAFTLVVACSLLSSYFLASFSHFSPPLLPHFLSSLSNFSMSFDLEIEITGYPKNFSQSIFIMDSTLLVTFLWYANFFLCVSIFFRLSVYHTSWGICYQVPFWGIYMKVIEVFWNLTWKDDPKFFTEAFFCKDQVQVSWISSHSPKMTH